MITVEAAGLTDTGKKRKSNEDCFFVDDALALYVVADGMGGHAAGEVASGLAIETIHNYMKSLVEKESSEEKPSRDDQLDRRSEQLLSGIRLANRSVLLAAQSKSSYSGMGTTISAVWFSDNAFIAANVGDSPVFHIRGDDIHLISVLHTFAAELVADNPDMTDVDRSFHHILTQAVGVREKIAPDLVSQSCAVGDVVVICSDGLTDMITTEEIRDIVAEHESSEGACQHLVERANEKGGEDNITVIVVKVTSVSNGNRGVFGRIKSLLKKMVR